MIEESIKNDIWRIYLKYSRTGVYGNKNNRIKLRNNRIGSTRYNRVKKKLTHIYLDKEYGIKSLAKELDLSYTVTRQLLEFLDIPMRKGRNVVTERVKKLRKEKAIFESEHKIGFNDPSIKRKYDGMARGVQGYYFNQSTQSYVWLRSSWEYIFAKWLDKTKHNWKIETKHYIVNDRVYRPDFFLYNDKWELTKIIEIKGYWDNNSDKAETLNKMIKEDMVIIRNMEKYIPENSTYAIELAEWKQRRILTHAKN